MAGALSDLAAMGARAGRGLPRARPARGLAARSARSSSCAAPPRWRERAAPTIAGGDVVGAPVLTVSVTAVGLGRARASSSCAATARAPATSSGVTGTTRGRRSGARGARRPRASQRGSRDGARARARTRSRACARARALAGAGVQRDDRPLRRRSRPTPRTSAAAAGVDLHVELAALPLADGRGGASRATLGEPPWRARGGAAAKTTSCASARRPRDASAVERALAALGGARVSAGSARCARARPGATLSGERGERAADRGVRAPVVAARRRRRGGCARAARSAARARRRAAARGAARAPCARGARTRAAVWRR